MVEWFSPKSRASYPVPVGKLLPLFAMPPSSLSWGPRNHFTGLQGV